MVDRRRRVKCDERRPGCNRCFKFGVECDGYRLHTKEHPLLGKQELAAKTLEIGTQVRSSPGFLQEQDEARYFRFYCEDVAAEIRGPFKTTLWESIVPQAAEMEPFVGHAIIALAAVSKSRRSQSCEKTSPDGSTDPHHQHALVHYGKALQGMRKALYSEERDLRKALIACLLVFCFESLQGRLASAAAYATSAVSLLYRWELEQSNPRISHHTRQSPIEEDLYLAFSGLDLQALLLVDNRPTSAHEDLKVEMSKAIKLMPSTFKDLKECRSFCELILRRNFHFIATARAAIQEEVGGFSTQVAGVETQEAARLRPGNNPWSVSSKASKQIPFILLQEQDQCLRDIQRWKLASAELFSRSSHYHHSSQTFFVTSMLKIHAAVNVIVLAQTFYPPETAYDNYMPEFNLINRLSASIRPLLVTSASSNSVFHFDIGVLTGLSQVGMYCRDKDARGKAIQMMLDMAPYREGIWDSAAAGLICDWVRKIEEEFLDENGKVPPQRRASLTSLNYSWVEKTAHVCCRQRTGFGMEDFVMRETTIRW